MDKEKEKWYLEHKGLRCPFCKKGNAVSYDSIEADADGATQSVECDSCGATWRDYYQLIGIIGD